MPIYEYKCQSCGQISEVLIHGFNSNKKLVCSKCGSEDLQKLMSVPNMVTEKPNAPGTTCCGRTERCDTPPCSSGGCCRS